MPQRDAVAIGSDAARSAFPKEASEQISAERQIHRFIVGLDKVPRPMTDEEVASELNDPFATRVLRQGVFPTTVHEVLTALDEGVPEDDPLRRQLSFLLGEGTQILWSEQTRGAPRGLRIAVTRGADNLIDVLVSTAATGDLSERFLQVMGWDEQSGVFHFYERQRGVWVWAGQSFHALEEPSRGSGPFDSHVNGSLVMKELKAPWIHWHSVDATVPPEILAPDDPARDDLLFTSRSGAELFEKSVVRPGIRRWTDARLSRTTDADGTVRQIPFLLRQLFETTSVNLVSSFTQSSRIDAGSQVDLPKTFFYDADSLTDTLQLVAPPALNVSGAHYMAARDALQTALVAGDFVQPGDTHFAFLVPERAAEDVDVVSKLLELELLNERFVACVLMIDFPNPVFSARRARLSQYAPTTGRAGTLVDELVAAIRTGAGQDPGGPEDEFLEHWALEDGWRSEFDRRLTNYFEALVKRLATEDGFAEIARLAESRRRRVRELELSEGRPLLFATTNISTSVPLLTMDHLAMVGDEPEALA